MRLRTATASIETPEKEETIEWDDVVTYLSVPVTRETIKLLNQLAAARRASITELLSVLVQEAAKRKAITAEQY